MTGMLRLDILLVFIAFTASAQQLSADLTACAIKAATAKKAYIDAFPPNKKPRTSFVPRRQPSGMRKEEKKADELETETYNICNKQANARYNAARAKVGPASPQTEPPADKLVACRQNADALREETLKHIYEAKDENPPRIRFGKTRNEIQAKNISDLVFEECVNPALVIKAEVKTQ